MLMGFKRRVRVGLRIKIKQAIFPSETRKTKVKPGVTDPLDSGVLRCVQVWGCWHLGNTPWSRSGGSDSSPGGGLACLQTAEHLTVDCSNHTLNLELAPSDLISKEALLASRMWQREFRKWWPWEVSPTDSGSDSLTSAPRLAAGECGNPEGAFWRRRWASPGQRVRQESRKLGLHAEAAWCYSKSNEHALSCGFWLPVVGYF